MRKATICPTIGLMMMVLLSGIALAQEPQWTVIEHVFLTQQTQSIEPTTLATPTEPGLYRISLYFSRGGLFGKGSYAASLSGFDISGLPFGGGMTFDCASIAGWYSMPPTTLMLRPQSSLTYKVVSANGQLSCYYNLAITVEQLVQQ